MLEQVVSENISLRHRLSRLELDLATRTRELAAARDLDQRRLELDRARLDLLDRCRHVLGWLGDRDPPSPNAEAARVILAAELEDLIALERYGGAASAAGVVSTPSTERAGEEVSAAE